MRNEKKVILVCSVLTGFLLVNLASCDADPQGVNRINNDNLAPNLSQPKNLETFSPQPDGLGVNNLPIQIPTPVPSDNTQQQVEGANLNASPNQIPTSIQSDNTQQLQTIHDNWRKHAGDLQKQAEDIQQLEKIRGQWQQNAEDHQQDIVDTLREIEGN